MKLSFGRALACAIFAIVPAQAYAIETVTTDIQVAVFSDGGTSQQLMGLDITSNPNQKMAAIGVQGANQSDPYQKLRAVFFSNAADWNTFAALWNKALQTPAPAATGIVANSTETGDFLDIADKAMVSVFVDQGKTISIIIVDPDKIPMMFRLQPRDFADFGKAMARVTAYFNGASPSIAGTWTLVCCSAKYRLTANLTEEGGVISGQFTDGSAISGTVNGTSVSFKRNPGTKFEQDYALTLSTDARTLSGNFTGYRDTTVGTETTMSR